MTRTAKRGSRLGLMVAGGALVASCAVLVAALSLRAPTPPVAAVTAAAEPPASLMTAPPASAPAGDPAPDPTAAQLDMPPVTLAGGAGVPDAGGPSRGRSRPGKRTWTQAAGPPPRRAPTEPQIVNEPRY